MTFGLGPMEAARGNIAAMQREHAHTLESSPKCSSLVPLPPAQPGESEFRRLHDRSQTEKELAWTWTLLCVCDSRDSEYFTEQLLGSQLK